jgi:small ligand-binding sensory domain FIST
MGKRKTNDNPGMAWGFSGHHDPTAACTHVLEQLDPSLEDLTPTFAILFASGYKPTALDAFAGRLGSALGIDTLVGMASTGIIGGRTTVEDRPGVAVLVGSFPGVEARAFAAPSHAVPVEDGDDLEAWAASLLRTRDDHQATILFADPTSLAVSRLIPELFTAGHAKTMLGALASISQPDKKKGEPALLFSGQSLQRGGLVGLTLAGAIQIDTLLAQGCRPVGPTMVVTRSRRNLICELGGRSAIEAVQAVAKTFSDEERRLLAGGLYIGIAVDEYRQRFGRGDFIIRKIIGGHGASGSIAIDEPVRPGRTVQVHLLDPALARDDLELLLDGQKLHKPPLGALILSDLARGKAMFEDHWSDAAAVARAFDVTRSGEDAAKGGYEIAGLGGPIPAAGCFSSGQIAPIGKTCRVHGSCSAIALFRGVDAQTGVSKPKT